ncbi:hypothetical protein OG618_00295 [Kitasatospora sp. NBC_01246]|uniref:hypothetical protein n=1 Tax=Kitasatospora sp. NBC_01246 TaxID=2903570 RepID=UPI002E339755|nr:hypothetical protein [Kitasatospora sp. NBC_01246]
MIDKHIFADVLIEGLDDWVPIDQLIWAAREGAEGRAWKEFFVELLKFLLESDLIQIGELAEDGFLPWKGGVDEVAQVVVDDLESLSWEPKLGSRAWIANTESGNEIARPLIDR